MQLTYDASRPWARQPCDDDASFAAFENYLALDPPRLISKLPRWPLDQLVAWRDECAWVERAHAIDMLDRPGRNERDGRHLAIVYDAAELVTLEVRKLLRLAETREESVLETRELAKLLKDVISLERLVDGASTDNVAVAATDLSRLSVEELEHLRALEVKAGANE